MRLVPVLGRSIDDYRAVTSNEKVNSLHRSAWRHAGLSVLHINSTAYGGGVAELLLAQIPLLRDLGWDAHWGVIDGDERFFEITKSVHNALQGNHEMGWTKEMADHYLEVVSSNLDHLPKGADVVVVHDPQPLAIPKLLGDRRFDYGKKWIWRCHIDSANPEPATWEFLASQMDVYDAAVFTMGDFVQKDIPVGRVLVSCPSIDPLSPKNAELADVTISDICRQYGLDVHRPIVSQVSRFDPWKDPLGVIEAYRKVKKSIPGVQLLLAGSLAHDDPEGLAVYETVQNEKGNDSDIVILSNFQEVGNTAINCFQRASSVVIQKSIREGFGLTVAEGAWKRRPVIGGRAGGITLQIKDGESGYLVDSIEQCADRTLELLNNCGLSERMGAVGRQIVQESYLTTRELSDWLGLITELLGG